MEKLIELLNEYEGQESWSYDKKYGIYIGWGDDLDYECYIISKKFGFIQWLVENKKIDVAKFGAVWEYESRDYWEDKEGNVTDYYYDNFEKHSDYESLLMLLSIQDNPIEFLCSILK